MPDSATSIEIIPWSGEAVALGDPVVAARCLREATHFWYDLRSFQERCRETLRDESDRRGQRTFEMDGFKVEVATPEASVETSYDVQKLWDGLEAAGLPLERLGELVTYEPRVSGTIARQLKKHPEYARIIEDAVLERTPKQRAVRIK